MLNVQTHWAACLIPVSGGHIFAGNHDLYCFVFKGEYHYGS